MKNLFFTIVALLAAGSLFTSCLSSEQKKEAADAQVVIARDNLAAEQMKADKLAEKAATANELKTFKLESDLKIKNNEVRIAELKLKMNKPGVASDEVYKKRIDSLIALLNLTYNLFRYEQIVRLQQVKVM